VSEPLWIAALALWALWWVLFVVSELSLRWRGEPVEFGVRSPLAWLLFLYGAACAAYGLAADSGFAQRLLAAQVVAIYGALVVLVVRRRRARIAESRQ
jgi:hypothetical protein